MKNEENYTDVDYTNDNISEEYEVINSDDVTVEDASDYQEEYEEENENINEGLVEFQRIDWENPTTVTSYGADLLAQIGKIESNKNALSADSETNRDKINDLIAKIENFIKNMAKDIDNEENDNKAKEQSKELVVLEDAIEKTNRGLRKLGKLIKRSYIKYKTDGQTSNITEAEFNEFKDNLRELSSLIDVEKENIEQGMEIYKEYLKMTAPYLMTFKYLIEEGKKEKEKQEIYLKEKYGNKELDRFAAIDYSYALKLVNKLSVRLKRLEDQLAMFVEQIYEAKLTLDNDEEMVTLYQEYIDITVPSLESKGESMLKVKVQRERINTLIDLGNMTNNAYRTTSDVIVANIDDVAKMNAEGTYKTETMKTLISNIQKGIKFVNDAEGIAKKTEAEKAKLRAELYRTIDTNALLGESYNPTFAIAEESSVQTDGQQVGKGRVRK